MLNTLFKYLNLSNDYDLILPHLYIGDYSSSQNEKFPRENDYSSFWKCQPFLGK